MRRAPERTSSSINDVPPSRRGSSASAAPGTTVSTGRTLPTGVGAPILLEHTKITRRVRPLQRHPHVSSIAPQPRAARLGGLRARVDADATTTLRLGDDSRAVAFA